MQLSLTASQLVELSGIPRGSVAFYVSSGVLQPSVRRARGKGQPHVFGFRDLVVARAVAQLRLPVEPMRAIADYWRSAAGAQVLDGISAEAQETRTTMHQQEVLLVLADGRLVVERNQPILELTRKLGAILHVLDPGQLVKTVTIDVTDRMMRIGLPQPGPGGRLPRDESKIGGRPRGKRKPMPALMREALEREAERTASARTKKR